MEDFTGIVTSTHSWENVSPEAAFQSSAVGMIHRTLFPKVSWNKVKKAYRYETGEDAVTWDWYVKCCLGDPGTTPDLAFSRNLNVWNMTLKDFLFTPLNKLEVYRDYREAECAAMVFPVVGKAVVLTPSTDVDDYYDRLVKYDECAEFLLVPIKDYAESLGKFDFCLGGEDAEF